MDGVLGGSSAVCSQDVSAKMRTFRILESNRKDVSAKTSYCFVLVQKVRDVLAEMLIFSTSEPKSEGCYSKNKLLCFSDAK